ncbi:MAG: hypothetical protein AAB600_02225 [Patescibacteria group bacterium]
MDSLTLQKIKDLLDKNNKIGIAVRKNPGIDEMGAALALYLSLLKLERSVYISCPTAPIVEVSSLVGIDKVKTSFDSGNSGDLTVSFPYKDGEIEKISYTLEDGFLNILVKAGKAGLSFNEKGIRYKRGGVVAGVVFTIGTPRLSDFGQLSDVQALKDTKIINIDNNAENQGYGDIVLASANLSSVSEQVASLIFSLDLKMDVDIAQNLLSGLGSATDNFQNPNTTPLAFEMAASLMKKGAVRIRSRPNSFFSPLTQKQPTENKEDEGNPPSDWLAPKIYKGSTTL